MKLSVNTKFEVMWQYDRRLHGCNDTEQV